MNSKSRVSMTPKLVAGAILIALGLLFTLDTLDIVDAGSIWEYWPLILIFVGVGHVARPKEYGSRTWGCLEIAAGLFFLLRNLGVFWISVWKVWPPLLLIGGIYIIWQAITRRPETEGGEGPEDGSGGPTVGERGSLEPRQYLNEFTLFGGGDRAIRSSNFRGGTVGAIFGGFDIDLREAVIAGDSASIDVFVLFGGVDLRVPESWNVNVKATPILGSSEYKPRAGAAPSDAPRKTLTVTGIVIFGGVEVKN
jgi:predicted membrane protein